jgi:hypothetical protein
VSHLSMETLLSLQAPGAEPGDAAAREHLEQCQVCRAEMDRLDQRVARLKALPALRPARDRWPAVAERVRDDRRARRQRTSGLFGLAAAASIALAVGIAPLLRPGAGDEPAGEGRIQEMMARSRALETALDRYDPESRVLDGRTGGIAQELEDRIARVDRELEMTELLKQRARDAEVLRLWRERVGLLDALVDVHVTRASNVGL